MGNLITGTALCHKEGMNLPVRVQIPMVDETRYRTVCCMVVILKRLHRINVNLTKEALTDSMYLTGLKMLNTI